MIVGIVGSEAAKFTPAGETGAREIIRHILAGHYPLTDDPLNDNMAPATEVVSGGCHLGGIDIWAAEIGRDMGLKVTEFLPKTRTWAGGYKPRNVQIAMASDLVCCLTVDTLPADYNGMRFDHCYHCNKHDHVKSGGCWTVHKAVELHKIGKLYVIYNNPLPGLIAHSRMIIPGDGND